MKSLPFVFVLALSFAPLAYAADSLSADTHVTKTEPAPAAATEPVKVAPEVLSAAAQLGVMQGHMNALLAQRDALDLQVKALQAKIDEKTATKDKLSK